MTDRQALLASVLARPADDQPRLVYADWLDEHGEHERAEFIRVQCELARLPEPPVPVRVGLGSHLREELAMALTGAVSKFLPADPHKAERDRLTARERELLDAHGRDWIGREVPVGFSDDEHLEFHVKPPQVILYRGWHYEANEHYHFARGFVGLIEMPAAGWLANHAALAWHPSQNRPCPETAQPITHLRLTTFPPYEWSRANRPPSASGGYVAADALKHVWPWLTVELPPEPWRGDMERAELETVPEFAGVTRWHPLENAAGVIVHPVFPELVARLADDLPSPSSTFGQCRIPLATYAFERAGVRYRLRAGRCQHGLAFFTRAEPQATIRRPRSPTRQPANR